MSEKHTLRTFDEDLARLRRRVEDLGQGTVRQVARGVESLLTGNRGLAEKVVRGDEAMDELQREVDGLVEQVLVRQQAMAQDLREILAASRIAIHLERCADYARNAARRSMGLGRPLARRVAAHLGWIRERVVRMLVAVMQAYSDRDAASADLAWASDDEVDELYRSLLETIVDGMREDPGFAGDGAQLLLVAKGLERIGDHATDIAEEVHLMVTGRRLRARGGA
jgi:phosphate transport system protein